MALTTIICTVHNQAPFVLQALHSAMSQVDSELIVVDNGSTDGGEKLIDSFCDEHPSVRLLRFSENRGLTAAFNAALAQATGDYVIDLAGDDVLLPGRVASGATLLGAVPEQVGVAYCNVQLITADGQDLGTHFAEGKPTPVEGWVFADLVGRYVVPAPGMMMRRSLLERLQGYDPRLAYEDFDFWVRSSRICQYVYQPEVLVQYRQHVESWSQTQYRRGSALYQRSTLAVCKKALALCRTAEERRALRRRCGYEARQAAKLGHLRLAYAFWKVARSVG